jgi:Uma2 family endonuclease
MSTVPAMPPTPAESMTPVSPPTELAPSIPDDMLYEVVDGQVVEKTTGTFETDIASLLDQILGTFARANRLGRVFSEMLFRIDIGQDLQRRPDVAFVSHARWPYNRRPRDVPVWDMVPDLAIEVISPSNSASAVQRKVHEYFKAGVIRVWVVYPEQAEVFIYSTPQQIQVVGVGQELDGGDLLAGFRLPVAVLFEDDPE